MGYYFSKSAIYKVQPFLDEMLRSDGDVIWSVADNTEPSKIAFAIRQGLKSASFFGLSEYDGLTGKYIIRSKPGQVIAELRNKLSISVVKQTVIDKITIQEANNLNSLVGAAIKHKAEEMYFPNLLNPNDELLNQLYQWTQAAGYKIVKNETGITLTKKEIGELEWKPRKSDSVVD